MKQTTVFKKDPNKWALFPIKHQEVLSEEKLKFLRRRKEGAERKRKKRLERRRRKLLRRIDKANQKKREYLEYLHSPAWRRLRKIIIDRSRGCCEECGRKWWPLDIHHLTYARFKKEFTTDLIALCRPCHDKEDKHPWKVKNRSTQPIP